MRRVMFGHGLSTARSVLRRQIEILSWEPFGEAHVGRSSVAFHAFEPGNASGDRCNGAVGLAGYALPGHRFEKFANLEAAGIAGGAFGWQDMVGARDFVAESHGGAFAQEQRTVIVQASVPPVEIGALHVQVF